mgnify:CR=1 FL=1
MAPHRCVWWGVVGGGGGGGGAAGPLVSPHVDIVHVCVGFKQDTKKKKGKGAAESALPPLEQVKGVWYGRGTESLKALDLSSNFITSSGAASILAGLYVDWHACKAVQCARASGDMFGWCGAAGTPLRHLSPRNRQLQSRSPRSQRAKRRRGKRVGRKERRRTRARHPRRSSRTSLRPFVSWTCAPTRCPWTTQWSWAAVWQKLWPCTSERLPQQPQQPQQLPPLQRMLQVLVPGKMLELVPLQWIRHPLHRPYLRHQ